jgi:hypothetical protein
MGTLGLSVFSSTDRVAASTSFSDAQAPAKTSMTRTFRSRSDRTIVQVIQSGKWEQAGAKIGTYQTDSSRGGLVNTGRDDPMGFYTRFADTSGQERCYGRMHIYIGDAGFRYGSQTTWQVDGVVRGYRCSTVGKKFELEMEQIASSTSSVH